MRKKSVICALAMVSAKPKAVREVSRRPACSGGKALVTSAENCAESGTTAALQLMIMTQVGQTGSPKVGAATMAEVLLTANAMMVISALSIWSAGKPARAQAMPPVPMAEKAVRLASRSESSAGRPTRYDTAAAAPTQAYIA